MVAARRANLGRTSNVLPLVTLFVGLLTLGGFLKQHTDAQSEQHRREIEAVVASVLKLEAALQTHTELRGHPALEMIIQELETQIRGVKELRVAHIGYISERIGNVEYWIKESGTVGVEANAAQWERIKSLERLVSMLWARANTGEQLPEPKPGAGDVKGSHP